MSPSHLPLRTVIRKHKLLFFYIPSQGQLTTVIFFLLYFKEELRSREMVGSKMCSCLIHEM